MDAIINMLWPHVWAVLASLASLVLASIAVWARNKRKKILAELEKPFEQVLDLVVRENAAGRMPNEIAAILRNLITFSKQNAHQYSQYTIDSVQLWVDKLWAATNK